MGNFWQDLDRYLGDYDRDERAAEIEQTMLEENSDYAVNGEDATCIPANFVSDADLPGARVHAPGHVEYIADQYGDPWGRFES